MAFIDNSKVTNGSDMTSLSAYDMNQMQHGGLTISQQQELLASMKAQQAQSAANVAGMSSSIDAQLANATGIGTNKTTIASPVGLGVTGGLAAISGGTSQITAAVGKVDSLSTLVTSPTAYLNSALKSVTSTFEGAVTNLASGINGSLSGIFKDTNVKGASDRVANISDPVKTLLTSKAPNSAAFKITGLTAGSETVTMSGSSSQFGSKSGDMIGTTLSTVLNRLNLDGVGTLGQSLTNAKSSLSVGGLFSDASKLVASFNTSPSQIIGGLTKTLSNDVQTFLGRSSTVVEASGIGSALSFFNQVSGNSLLDQRGNMVNTGGISVDATTGNALLDLVRYISCDASSLNGTSYTSTNETMSLFNLGLGLASGYGMEDLVDNLLGCPMTTTAAGQTAVINAFANSTASNVDMSSSLLTYVSNQKSLNTELITTSLITNPNLTAADKTTVDAIMTSIGTTTKEAYAVKEVSLDSMLVYDYKKIVGSNTAFTDKVFLDSALTNYTKGKPVAVAANGAIAVA